MAQITKNYLDLSGLTTYDEKIKELIPTADGTTIIKNANGTLSIKDQPKVEKEVLILS